jgi:uncharacterized membrane protein
MSKTNKTVVGAITTLLALGAASANAVPVCAEQERCYGVARAGKNDCATAKSSCATTAKQDFQKDAWVYVPKGTCAKLGGGTTDAKAAAKETTPGNAY